MYRSSFSTHIHFDLRQLQSARESPVALVGDTAIFGVRKIMSGPRDTYDISAVERKILEARAARRTKLRYEYLKQVGNPYRMATGEGGTVFDSGLQRFMSMKATSFEFWRPNTQNSLFLLGGIILPIAVVMYVVIGSKNRQEHRYRTGQISYRDRKYKFT